MRHKRSERKKILSCILILTAIVFCCLTAYASAEDAPPDGTPAVEEVPQESMAQGEVVIEQRTGKILKGRQEHMRLYPASTTKILTAWIASEYGHLDEMVTVGDEINLVAWDGTKAGLVENEKLTMRDLILGMLINSGNDAANTIAVHIARSVSGKPLKAQEALNYFSNLMNQRAREAGARESHFINPHGYHDPNHYTTAYDLAMIGRAAMKNDFFRKAISVTSMDTTNGATGEPRFWRSRNKLLNKKSSQFYEYATGGKTGYTSKSGQCLVSFAAKDGMDLIAVMLNAAAGQRWSEARELFEYGFANYQYQQILKNGTVIKSFPVENHASGDEGSLAVEISSGDWGDAFLKQDIPEIRKEIQWDESQFVKPKGDGNTSPRLKAPIQKGQAIGQLTVSLRGKVLTRVPLTAVRDVKKRTALDALTPDTSKKSFPWTIAVASVALAVVLLKIIVHWINHRRRRRNYYLYHKLYHKF